MSAFCDILSSMEDSKMFKTWQDYFDLGNDTERWWRAHTKGVGIHLVHTPRAKGYDFRGSMGDDQVFIDVKFCRTKYYCPGWVEVFTNGKLSGIIQTAKEYYKHDNVQVHLVVMEAGWWYLYDVKEMLTYWMKGELQLQGGSAKDDIGNVNASRHWQMRGWDDNRFLVAKGPLQAKHWQPKTKIGEAMDVNKWMTGVWPFDNEEHNNDCQDS